MIFIKIENLILYLNKKYFNNLKIMYQFNYFLKFRDFIDISKLDWCCLSSNTNAIELLKKIKIK